jgi:hypothetical protein
VAPEREAALVERLGRALPHLLAEVPFGARPRDTEPFVQTGLPESVEVVVDGVLEAGGKPLRCETGRLQRIRGERPRQTAKATDRLASEDLFHRCSDLLCSYLPGRV